MTAVGTGKQVTGTSRKKTEWAAAVPRGALIKDEKTRVTMAPIGNRTE